MINRLKWVSIYFTISVIYLILTLISILSPSLADKMLQEFHNKCEEMTLRALED